MTTDPDSEAIDTPVRGIIESRGARNAFGVVLRILISQGTSVVAFLLLSIFLQPDEYGVYLMAAALPPAIAQIVCVPLIQLLVRKSDTVTRTHVNEIGSIALIGGATIGAVVIGTTLLAEITLWPVGAACAVYLVLVCSSTPSIVVLQRNLHVARASWVMFVDRIVFQAGTVALLALGLPVLSSLALATIAAGLSALLAAQTFHRWKHSFGLPARTQTIALLRSATTPAAHLFATVATGILLVPLLAAVSTPEEAGLFAWAYSVTAIPIAFTAAAGAVLYPTYSRMDMASAVRLILPATRLVALLGSLAVVTVLVAIPALLDHLIPSRWGDGVGALQIMSVGVIASTTTAGIIQYWAARISLQQAARWQLLGAASSLMLSGALAVVAGAAAGAAGWMFAQLLISLLAIRAARQSGFVRLGFLGGVLLASTCSVVVGTMAGGLLISLDIGPYLVQAISCTLIGVMAAFVTYLAVAGAPIRHDLKNLFSAATR